MEKLKVKDLIDILIDLSEEEQEALVYIWYGRERTGFNIDGLSIERDLNPKSTPCLSLRIDIDRM